MNKPTNTESTMPNATYNFVVSCLHHKGANYSKISDKAQHFVRLSADGFGKGTTDPDLLWDWSHVRDSSDAAIADMAAQLRFALAMGAE